MSKSGLADSPFFSMPSPVNVMPVSPPSPELPLKEEIFVDPVQKENPLDTIQPRDLDTKIPSNYDTTVSSNHETTVSLTNGAMIEIVRKAVKEFGKEAATHRFTLEEKKSLLDLVYSYKNLGIRTSENEISRIAINAILEDYRQNGNNSILDKVLRALNE